LRQHSIKRLQNELRSPSAALAELKSLVRGAKSANQVEEKVKPRVDPILRHLLGSMAPAVRHAAPSKEEKGLWDRETQCLSLERAALLTLGFVCAVGRKNNALSEIDYDGTVFHIYIHRSGRGSDWSDIHVSRIALDLFVCTSEHLEDSGN
jgi:hypothetical protein